MNHGSSEELIYKDNSLSITARVDALLKSMNLDEKIGQLGSTHFMDIYLENGLSKERLALWMKNGIGQVSRLGGQSVLSPQERAKTANEIQDYLIKNTRLGIPAIIHEECCSGVMAMEATRFPQMIGLASTWMPELAETMTSIIRRQMRATGSHQGLAPVLDVLHEPRWGRIEETFGEDPVLISHFGMAYVRGLQGEKLADGVLATGKHYVGHSISEGGLNCTPVHIGFRELWDTFLLPFEAIIREAKLGSMMNSYSEMDGEVVAASKTIMTDILRGQLGFDGIVVSDYEAIKMLNTLHRISEDLEDAAVKALKAGIDLELPQTLAYGEPLKKAVQNGKIKIEEIDVSVSRILQKKYELGIMDNPFVDEAKVTAAFNVKGDQETARKIAEKSLVLLKNKDNLLPVSKEIKTIAVIGPNADQARCFFGDYSHPAGLEMFLDSNPEIEAWLNKKGALKDFRDSMDSTPTVLEVIKKTVSPKSKILFAKGCDVNSTDRSGFIEASNIASQADLIIMVMGDKSGLVSDCTCGEFRDRTNLTLPGVQEDLILGINQNGKPLVLVLVNGRPYDLSKIEDKCTAIVEAWLPGEASAAAIAGVLFGDINPGGKITVSLPRSVGQIPIYYNHKPSGGHSHFRGDYVDEKTTPLFPFGHGLSYTRFEYSDLTIGAEEIKTDDKNVVISCKVKNTGKRSGDEVVQLYIQDEFASIPRPVKELKAYKRLTLTPNETKKVTFNLPVDQLAFYNVEMKLVVEPGKIGVMVGSSSEDIRLSGSFKITGAEPKIVNKRVFECPVKVE